MEAFFAIEILRELGWGVEVMLVVTVTLVSGVLFVLPALGIEITALLAFCGVGGIAIGWRLTVVRTFDKRPLYIPNSVFTKLALENPARMTNRRIRETIGIRYNDAEKMGPIVAEIKQMLVSHPEIDTNMLLMVNFNTFASSSLEFFIYAFTKTTNWLHFHEVKQDILLQIIEIVRRQGADFAFPTTTLDGLNVLRPEPAEPSLRIEREPK